jgi:ribosome-associated translation inhibitor RaiA
MQIQINTDKHIDGNERMINFYTSELKKELARFDDKITRVEVHLGDENSDKFGKNDKKCVIEVRVANIQPLVVSDHNESPEKAFFLAIEKAKKVLNSTFDKMKEH